MASSSFPFIVLSIALLVSMATASVDDACKAAAASKYSINYNFCATSLRADPRSETASPQDLATIAAMLTQDNAMYTQKKLDDMIEKGGQTTKVLYILKLCSNGVYGKWMTVLSGTVASLLDGKLTDAASSLNAVNGGAHDCGDLFVQGGEKNLVAKDESDLEGLSALALFLVIRLV